MQPGGHILLVDDNADIRSIFGDLLTDEGYVVQTARDGREALNKLRSFPLDLLLSDLQMPGIDGVELIRRVHEILRGVPAILLTASREENAKEIMLTAGASALLIKPVELDDLLATVRRVFAARQPAEDGAIADAGR